MLAVGSLFLDFPGIFGAIRGADHRRYAIVFHRFRGVNVGRSPGLDVDMPTRLAFFTSDESVDCVSVKPWAHPI